jgi:hypothetical protein
MHHTAAEFGFLIPVIPGFICFVTGFTKRLLWNSGPFTHNENTSSHFVLLRGGYYAMSVLKVYNTTPNSIELFSFRPLTMIVESCPLEVRK